MPGEIQTIIVQYRQEHPAHGYQRIEDYLRDRYFIKISRKEIRKVSKAYGLSRMLDSSFDREELPPAKGTRRFEASAPTELYQMDLSDVYISGVAALYLILIIDDHRRFCVGHVLVSDQKSLTMINALNRCIERLTQTIQKELREKIRLKSYEHGCREEEKTIQVFWDGKLIQ